jgi:hypothetical protein
MKQPHLYLVFVCRCRTIYGHILNLNLPFETAHFGISKTLNRIKKDFHWYKMSEDVKFHVKCCTVCNRFKSLNKKPRTALQKYLVGHPMDRIGIDVVSNMFLLLL